MKQIRNNVWQAPIRKNYKMVCCDCGLVHEADFRVHKGQIQFRVRRKEKGEKMNVYIVSEGERYEGSTIKAVYGTLRKAKKYVKKNFGDFRLKEDEVRKGFWVRHINHVDKVYIERFKVN